MTLFEENFVADTPTFHPFVVNHKTSSFPVKQLHGRTTLVEKHVNISISRIQRQITNQATEAIKPFAQINTFQTNNKSIPFIQTKHNFFATKFRFFQIPQNTAYLGWLLFTGYFR